MSDATVAPAPSETNDELELVKSHLERADPDGARFARVIRATYDQLYDGQRTGRYSWPELHKTEKTHMGTLVEINLHREFEFDDGESMDYRIAGVDVDCKFSAGRFKWMIPTEAVGHLCLVVWANDEISSWSADLVRITRDRLGGGERGNKDGKRSLNQLGRDAVVPLWQGELEENLLLHLEEDVRKAVLCARATYGTNHGQARVNALFWHVQKRLIPRTAVATVAQQHDYMKRVRYDAGARSRLRDRGVVILGHQPSHQAIARDLWLPVPTKGEFVSIRLTRAGAGSGPSTMIGDEWWTVAGPDDPQTTAPKLEERASS